MTTPTPKILNFRKSKLDKIMQFYGEGPYSPFLDKLYSQGMSSFEIAEKILKETKIEITPRSIQRALVRSGITMRKTRDSFNLAYSKGRVVYKNAVPYALVYSVMREKGFNCTYCRASAEDTQLNGWYDGVREKGKRIERKFVIPVCNNCFAKKSNDARPN